MASHLCSEDIAAIEKREIIKQEINSGAYRYLPLILLDRLDIFIKRISHSSSPLPGWYSILVIALLTPLSGLLISLILGESISLLMFGVGVWGVSLGIWILVTVKISIARVFDLCVQSILDNIMNEDDSDDFHKSIQSSFNLRNQASFIVVMSSLVSLFAVGAWMQSQGSFPGFGPLWVVLLVSAQCTSGLYGLVVVSYKLFSGTSKYRYKLFPANPSNSEVIHGLSALINTIILFSSSVATIASIGLFLFDLVNSTSAVVFLLLTTWGPLIIIFFFGHSNIAKIIITGKRKCLQELQGRIEELHRRDVIPTKETTEHINALLDYYNKVKSSGNSAIDTESSLGLVNSLLLPVIPLALNYIDRIIAMFKG